MLGLDHIGTLLTDSVDRVLDTAVRDDRNNRSISNTELLDTVDLELRVHHTLIDILRETGSTSRVEGSLATVQNGSVHLLVGVERHFPWVLALNQVLEALALEQQVIAESDTLTHGNNIEVIGEEIKVDIRLLEGVGTVQGHLTRVGDRADQVNDHGKVITGLRGGEVPLEGGTEHADEVELEVRLSQGREWVLASIGGFRLAVFGILLEILVDTGESDQFE